MSKPKSILKKPSGSAGPSNRSASANSGASAGGSGKGSKFRQSFPVGREPVQKGKGKGKGKGKAPVSEEEEDEDEEDEDSVGSEELDRADLDDDVEDGSDGGAGEDDELDTDEEISRSKKDQDKSRLSKSSQTKRKAPTTAETFGSTLTALLSEHSTVPGPSKRAKTGSHPPQPDALNDKPSKPKPKPQSKAQSSQPILSLSHAKLPPTAATLSLERRAARKVKLEREEKLDRARIRDVVEGWTAADGTGGMEFEKGLRKVAQRGVIKLFNAILVASKSSEAAATTLSAKAGVKEERGRKKEKDNVLGRGKNVGETGPGLTSESFLDLVRKG